MVLNDSILRKTTACAFSGLQPTEEVSATYLRDKGCVHYKLLALQEEQGRVRHVGNHGLSSCSVVGLVLSERVLCIHWSVSAAVEYRLDYIPIHCTTKEHFPALRSATNKESQWHVRTSSSCVLFLFLHPSSPHLPFLWKGIL